MPIYFIETEDGEFEIDAPNEEALRDAIAELKGSSASKIANSAEIITPKSFPKTAAEISAENAIVDKIASRLEAALEKGKPSSPDIRPLIKQLIEAVVANRPNPKAPVSYNITVLEWYGPNGRISKARLTPVKEK